VFVRREDREVDRLVGREMEGRDEVRTIRVFISLPLPSFLSHVKTHLIAYILGSLEIESIQSILSLEQ